MRDLKQDHFQIYKDSDGREYVAQARDELTKKTREDNRSTRTDGGRMYETRDNNCPVVSFKKYTSKLNPACNAFFQTPKSVAPSTGPWYKKCPVGVNILGMMMVEISKNWKVVKSVHKSLPQGNMHYNTRQNWFCIKRDLSGLWS